MSSFSILGKKRYLWWKLRKLIAKAYTLQTYQHSCILHDSHAFLSVIIQLGTSSQMSRKFLILSYILQLPTQFNVIKQMVTSVPVSRRCENVESIHHWHIGKAISCNLAPSKTQISSLEPNLYGPSGSTTFVLFSHKWITKCWQVRPCRKLNQVNHFHAN